ncbi:TPA: fimbrial protein [Proteus mirabilis]|uniref:fimbrial protein n=1 Tax=Proteus mirabilis TaxID=584 RepID=UPI0029EFE8B9|nr:fimbrial protein [Proteus mirabilis]HEK2723278.1 fimbrial protein [Proteus mirabilis]
MKSINITFLIPLLLLYFPFIALSNSRGSLPPPISCEFSIPDNIKLRDIRPDSFPSNYAGTLAKDRYSKSIAVIFSRCSENNTKITLRIDNANIDFNNGYLINDVAGSEASDNVTFQLTDDENNPIDLNQNNTFIETINESGIAYFNFFINYVKKDNLSAKPGGISSRITFIVEAKEQIVEDSNEFAGVEERIL